MSADNYLYINPKNYEVWDCVASCVSKNLKDQKLSLIGKGKNINEALKITEKFENELEDNGSYLEYGLHFKIWCK
jgi:hypothetical protein